MHDRVVRGVSWQYGEQDFDGAYPGRGTVVALFPKDRLVQVRWDNQKLNYYHTKPSQRDVRVVGRSFTDNGDGSGSNGSDGSGSGDGGSGSGGSGGSGAWNYLNMRLFGIPSSRVNVLMEKLTLEEQQIVNGLSNGTGSTGDGNPRWNLLYEMAPLYCSDRSLYRQTMHYVDSTSTGGGGGGGGNSLLGMLHLMSATNVLKRKQQQQQRQEQQRQLKQRQQQERAKTGPRCYTVVVRRPLKVFAS